MNSQIYPLWRVGRWHPCNLSSIGTLNSQSWIHKSSKLETEALIPWMVWLEILWSKGSWRVWIILTSICCLGFPASWPKRYPELMGFWSRFNETSLQKNWKILHMNCRAQVSSNDFCKLLLWLQDGAVAAGWELLIQIVFGELTRLNWSN